MAMRVKEVAELAGISVRTLHHYDEIGLLTPDAVTESGYRLYSDENLATLQQILFFRELGFPLKKIKEIIHDPTFNRQEALALHRDMLLEQRRRIDNMVRTIDKTIKHMKGEIEMSNEDKFVGFDFSKNPYEEEARKRWGNKAVDESKEKLGNLSEEDQKKMGEEMGAIYTKLVSLMDKQVESPEVQQAIGEWYTYLNRIGTYTPEAFKGLGEMYVADVRFTKNIDQFGEGLAAFMRDAMAAFADNYE